MNYADTMQTNPPRLVVTYQRGPGGEEAYQWGVVGNIPILSIIGYIGKVQADLIAEAWIPECDNPVPALVITWDAEERNLAHFANQDIPRDSLGGMLELIKTLLVGSRMAQHAGAQRAAILGPDGKPMRA